MVESYQNPRSLAKCPISYTQRLIKMQTTPEELPDGSSGVHAGSHDVQMSNIGLIGGSTLGGNPWLGLSNTQRCHPPDYPERWSCLTGYSVRKSLGAVHLVQNGVVLLHETCEKGKDKIGHWWCPAGSYNYI